MAKQDPQTERLLERASGGDASATGKLMEMHRVRLQRMIAVRMDSAMAARVDASDVVQDALAEPARRLPQFLQREERLFYPWLRQIGWERLIQLHRQHIYAQKRSVRREVHLNMPLPDESTSQLSQHLLAIGTTPSVAMMREEKHERLRIAIKKLNQRDREVLVLRHLEQLSVKEVAAVLGISEAAVQSRYRRAIERLHEVLAQDSAEDSQ